MSESQPSKVFMFGGGDEEMEQAHRKARVSFRYFWREVAWERRRIVPALDLACVKAPFSDGESVAHSPDDPQVEHMWLSEVDFDGRLVSGILLNEPNWLKSVKQGDSVRLPLNQISDWMYAIDGEVYGAYTVNLMRSRMDRRERAEHDQAWGLNFGDPRKIRIVPVEKKGGILKGWFGKQPDAEPEEHPMSQNMASSLAEQLQQNPELLRSTDDRGWTLLHQEALAGSAPTVKVLLDHGAEVNVKTNQGMTPLQLARTLQWERVVALLASKGGV